MKEIDKQLHKAIKYGNPSNGFNLKHIEQLMIDGANIESTDKGNNERRPIHVAIICSNTPALRFLIRHNADIYSEDKSGTTPIILAENHSEAHSALLENDFIKPEPHQSAIKIKPLTPKAAPAPKPAPATISKTAAAALKPVPATISKTAAAAKQKQTVGIAEAAPVMTNPIATSKAAPVTKKAVVTPKPKQKPKPQQSEMSHLTSLCSSFSLHPNKENFYKLAFIIANNDINVLRPADKQAGIVLDDATVLKLYRPTAQFYAPEKIVLTHNQIVEFIRFVGSNLKNEVLFSCVAEALDNIAFRKSTTMHRFSRDETILFLKVAAEIEPFTISLLSCFDMGIYDLTHDHDLSVFPSKEIIDMAYYSTKVSRPITGNIGVALEKLTTWMMKIDVDEIARNNLLPRVVKIINFMEICKPEVKIDLDFKHKVNARIMELLSNSKPTSSKIHEIFSARLKEVLRKSGIKIIVEDEFLCSIVGTHLDIAIPEYKIAIEINGPTHYLDDQTTETPETKIKRELLESIEWKVVSVPVCEISKEKVDFEKIDEIIFDRIINLILSKQEKIAQSILAAEANRNFFLFSNSGSRDCKTAKEYNKMIERVFDPLDARRRHKERKLEMLNRKPIVSQKLPDGRGLELDLDAVDMEQVTPVIYSFIGLMPNAGENPGAGGVISERAPTQSESVVPSTSTKP